MIFEHNKSEQISIIRNGPSHPPPEGIPSRNLALYHTSSLSHKFPTVSPVLVYTLQTFCGTSARKPRSPNGQSQRTLCIISERLFSALALAVLQQ